jgi:hypothetical protein
MTIEPDGSGGWFIKREARYFHLTSAWCDDMYRHQIKPNKSENPAFNRLRHLIETGSTDSQVVADTFTEAYGQIIGNRLSRKALGLKAVTKDGDEDLKAVQNGAPVRPWNAEHKKSELHEWMKRDKNR